MKIHLVADREPYLSYLKLRDPRGSLFFCPPEEAELEVLPAAAFLEGGAAPGRRVLAYGPVSLMAASFEAGCADYLRDPWSLAELELRARRAEEPLFTLGDGRIELRGASLRLHRAGPAAAGAASAAGLTKVAGAAHDESSGGQEPALALSEAESRFLRLLVENSGEVVSREAIDLRVWGASKPGSRRIDALAARIRSRLELLFPGVGNTLEACRGYGYRLRARACGYTVNYRGKAVDNS